MVVCHCQFVINAFETENLLLRELPFYAISFCTFATDVSVAKRFVDVIPKLKRSTLTTVRGMLYPRLAWNLQSTQ